MRKFTNVRSIELEITYDVCGCVNYDGPEAKYALTALGLYRKNPNGKDGDNNKFAKRHFNPENPSQFRYSVSGECQKKAIYNDTMAMESPDRAKIPHMMPIIAAHPDMISRGYVIAGQMTNLHKSSALCLPDAEETGPWRDTIVMDFHSRSGEKNLKEERKTGDGKDTTIYKSENVGRGEYKTHGFINVENLQFISADPIFDRQAILVDGGIDEKIFLDELKKNMVNFTPELRYWFRKNNYLGDKAAEYGVLLNDDSVDMLIKRILKKILSVKIERSYAWLRLKDLSIRVICDGNPSQFKVTAEDIDDLYFEPHIWYEEATIEQYKENERLNEEMKERERAAKKDKGKSKDTETESSESEE